MWPDGLWAKVGESADPQGEKFGFFFTDASHGMPGFSLETGWDCFRAGWYGDWASGSEGAAGWRIGRIGKIALQDDPIPGRSW